MRFRCWRAVGATFVLTLLVVLTVPIAVFELRPYQREYVFAWGSVGSSFAKLEYTPGDQYATLWLEVDNTREWHALTYDVTWAEPWAPRWGGSVGDQIAGRIRFEFQFATAEPMRSELAIRMVDGLRVSLKGDVQYDEVRYTRRAGWERWDLSDAFRHWWIDRWWKAPKVRGVA